MKNQNIGRCRCVALLLIVGFFLLSCDAGDRAIITLGVANAPVTLDPRFATDATSERINRLLYQRLVAFNDKQQPIPGLARWEKLSDTAFRFILLDSNNKFHNGAKLTAYDVAATYEFILDPMNASPHRTLFSVIKRIETPDKLTIDFHLHRADALFPAYLVIGIIPKSLIKQKHPFNRQPVGSGPFAFKDWPMSGQVQIKRLSDQQVFEIVHVPDSTVRVLKLVRGELDIVQNDLSPELIAYLHRQKGIDVKQTSGSNFTYLGFNLQDAFVGKQKIRKAIALALDRQTIIKYMFAGAARMASALLPPDHWAGNPNLTHYPYDPAQATHLLEQLGYTSEKPLRIVYKTSTDPFRVRLATVIQHQLAKVGVQIELRSYDWGTFYADIKAGNFQMYSLSWIGIKTPDIFKYVFHSESVPPYGANRGRYISTSVDQLIDQAQITPTTEEQAELFRLIQKKLWEELPYIPLWYENHIYAARQTIQGYTMNSYGNFDGLIHVNKHNI